MLLKAELSLMDNSFEWTNKNKNLSDHYKDIAKSFAFKYDDDFKTYKKLLEFKGAIVLLESDRLAYEAKNGSNLKTETIKSRNEMFMSVAEHFEAIKTQYEEIKIMLAQSSNEYAEYWKENQRLVSENELLKQTLLTTDN